MKHFLADAHDAFGLLGGRSCRLSLDSKLDLALLCKAIVLERVAARRVGC